jgi:hypothetical protein
VFMIDEDFAIERPKRVYRAGLHFMKGKTGTKDKHGPLEDADIDHENPFARDMIINSGEGKGEKATQLDAKDGEEAEASHHTFFIVNSQRRLKLVAKNARQMHQVSQASDLSGAPDKYLGLVDEPGRIGVVVSTLALGPSGLGGSSHGSGPGYRAWTRREWVVGRSR